MPYLIAQGPESQQRWRRKLPTDATLRLGREAEDWSVPWDDRISRDHADIRWQDGQLDVCRVATARNPVFFRGTRRDRFSLRPGEHFVIGSTSFHLANERVDVTHDVPRPVTEQAFTPRALSNLRFRDADSRIEMLSRLPEVIAGASSDADLFVCVLNLLLNGIPRADFVAVVRRSATGQVDVLHWDGRGRGNTAFAPSARLIHKAVSRNESVVHIWQETGENAIAQFTQTAEADWAFCSPLGGESSPGWAIYVAGRVMQDSEFEAHDASQLQDDLKFTEVAANTFSRVRELRRLERRQASLSQFISPVVLERLAEHDPDDVLAPREAEVSVLFCDLRGFSRKSELSADDLMGLLRRVSQALGVMTHQILDSGGVVGDFHGDAAMGFWGWPLPQQDAVLRACKTALAIRAEFAAAGQKNNDPLAGFRMGIGIATGKAVAGKIGTVDQVKITVFGPVVNLAARLEEMTKRLRAPILMDETTARLFREQGAASLARVRRVARVRPPGLETPCEVSELLPSAAEYPQLSDEHIASYEAALDALLGRDWSQAFGLLHSVPADDRVKDFLTVYIAQHNRTPPENWDGVVDF